MNPLKVALIIKNSNAPKERENRNMGYWSYPVPEFIWEHYWYSRGASVDLNTFRDFDLVFHEDTTNDAHYAKFGVVPLVFLDIDSTLSEQHLYQRKLIAAQADLVLVDHAPLKNFTDGRGKTRRLGYCVNDRVFKDYGAEKSTDITFHCSNGTLRNYPGARVRTDVRQLLDAYAKQHKLSYRSGVLGLNDYAESFNAAKVCVNIPRTSTNRPHRVFDVMASRSCLLSRDFPHVDSDRLVDGEHYYSFFNQRNLIEKLDWIFEDETRWQRAAGAGYQHVMATHTWTHCAKRLREIIREELGI